MKLKVKVRHNEHHKIDYVRDFTVVDELPEVGYTRGNLKFDGEQKKIVAVEKAIVDCTQDSTINGAEYEFYQVSWLLQWDDEDFEDEMEYDYLALEVNY